jgi:hypothetical protein
LPSPSSRADSIPGGRQAPAEKGAGGGGGPRGQPSVQHRSRHGLPLSELACWRRFLRCRTA